MSYTKLNPQPTGLSEGETALELDDGTLVAVKVSTTRPPNNSGMVFSVSAHCIDADGTAQTCACGDPIDIEFAHNANADEVGRLGADVIAREMLYAALGEPLTTEQGEPDDTGNTTYPILPLSDLASRSIRNARILANASVPLDPATVLGL